MHHHRNRKQATEAFLARAKAYDVLQRTYGDASTPVRSARQAAGATLVVGFSPYPVQANVLFLGSPFVVGGS
jgi:hypothetical protein